MEVLFKTGHGDFYAIEPLDRLTEATAAETAYRDEWAKYLAGTVPNMPHHPFEGKIALLDPGKLMVYYTITRRNPDGRLIPAQRQHRVMRDASPLDDHDIRTILEHPNYYVTSLWDLDILSTEEYNELETWAIAENAKWGIKGRFSFPLHYYARHPLFKKLIDGRLGKMHEWYRDGRYGWRMFRDPVPVAAAQQPKRRGRKKRREMMEAEDQSGLPADFVRYCVAQQHAHRFDAIVKALDQREQDCAVLRPDDCPLVPNVAKKDALYPHQALSLAKLRHFDTGTIDIDVGGGKLRVLVYDALLALKDGRCKRPALIMPKATIPQQKFEIEKFTRDKVNVIVVSTETMTKLGGEIEGLARLARLVRRAPINTVLLVSYEWLRSGGLEEPEGIFLVEPPKVYKKDDLGNPVLDKDGNPVEIKLPAPISMRYPRVEWLIDECRIDYAALDESHTIKNLGSLTGEACLHLGSVPVKRISTGTITPNNPRDLWRQYAFLNPGVFRRLDDFMRDYSQITDQRGQVRQWKETALSEIRQKILKYGAVSFRHTAWKHLLPKKFENYHYVELREKQQQVYKLLMEDVAEEIRAEWESFIAQPNVKRDVEFRALIVKLTRMDSLLTAMGQDAGGANIKVVDDLGNEVEVPAAKRFVETLDGDDKISPKIAKIDEILDDHFSDPRNGKVIIFVQNELSAQHIYDNIKMHDWAGWYMKAPGLRPVSEAKDFLKRWLDPNDKRVKILCAVDRSLRTGLNLQKVCNRVINADCLWDPGTMDQRQGRIDRPRSPFADAGIFIDWIVTENTAEITKFARLLSKLSINAQVNSGFVPSRQYEQIRMNPLMIEDYKKWSDIEVHRQIIDEMAVHEDAESQRFQQEFGNDTFKRADGLLPHSKRMPFVPMLRGERRAKQQAAVAKHNGKPIIRVEHREWNGRPFIEIGDKKTMGSIAVKHVKKLGLVKRKSALLVEKSDHYGIKQVVEQLRAWGYRLDYQRQAGVPDIARLRAKPKLPHAPKVHLEAKQQGKVKVAASNGKQMLTLDALAAEDRQRRVRMALVIVDGKSYYRLTLPKPKRAVSDDLNSLGFKLRNGDGVGLELLSQAHATATLARLKKLGFKVSPKLARRVTKLTVKLPAHGGEMANLGKLTAAKRKPITFACAKEGKRVYLYATGERSLKRLGFAPLPTGYWRELPERLDMLRVLKRMRSFDFTVKNWARLVKSLRRFRVDASKLNLA